MIPELNNQILLQTRYTELAQDCAILKSKCEKSHQLVSTLLNYCFENLPESTTGLIETLLSQSAIDMLPGHRLQLISLHRLPRFRVFLDSQDSELLFVFSDKIRGELWKSSPVKVAYTSNTQEYTLLEDLWLPIGLLALRDQSSICCMSVVYKDELVAVTKWMPVEEFTKSSTLQLYRNDLPLENSYINVRIIDERATLQLRPKDRSLELKLESNKSCPSELETGHESTCPTKKTPLYELRIIACDDALECYIDQNRPSSDLQLEFYIEGTESSSCLNLALHKMPTPSVVLGGNSGNNVLLLYLYVGDQTIASGQCQLNTVDDSNVKFMVEMQDGQRNKCGKFLFECLRASTSIDSRSHTTRDG